MLSPSYPDIGAPLRQLVKPVRIAVGMPLLLLGTIRRNPHGARDWEVGRTTRAGIFGKLQTRCKHETRLGYFGIPKPRGSKQEQEAGASVWHESFGGGPGSRTLGQASSSLPNLRASDRPSDRQQTTRLGKGLGGQWGSKVPSHLAEVTLVTLK
jgi:hypothetical protein